ncbi:MAG: alpha,2-mannosyltransferase [Blastocatellia bacterium]
MPKARFMLLVGLAVLVAFAGFAFIRNLIDFPVYYAAGQSLLSHRTDLYAPDFALGQVMDYRYPPFFLLLFWPLWLLPYKVAAYLWYLFSIAEIALVVFFIRRVAAIESEKKGLKKGLWLVVFFVVAPYFVTILHYGNAHLLAIFLLFAAFTFVVQKKPRFAGLALALAISIKLTPALILPYFALRKQWRLLASVAVFLAVINLAPAIHFGFAKNNELLKNWFEHVVVSQEFHEANGPINLSLKGQLRRYFSDVDYSQRVDGDVYYPAINLTSVSEVRIDLAWKIVSALLCLMAFGLIVLERRRLQLRRRSLNETNSQAEREANTETCEQVFSDLFALEMALLICLMLLVGPLTSKIYFIALLWPVASLATFAFNQATRQAQRVRRLLIGLAIVNSVLPLLPGRSLQRLLLVLGVDFYVNLLLFLAVVYVLRATARLPQRRCGEPQMSSLSTTRTS